MHDAFAMTFARVPVPLDAPCRWGTLCDELAEALNGRMRIQDLVGRCPSIAGYARRTQGNILRAHVASHGLLTGDRIVRDGHWIEWRIEPDRG